MLLEVGQELIFTTHECVGKEPAVHELSAISTGCCNCGDVVLIDDGKIQLHCDQYQSAGCTCNLVESRGKLSSRKVNLPRTKISLPSLTAKDLETWFRA